MDLDTINTRIINKNRYKLRGFPRSAVNVILIWSAYKFIIILRNRLYLSSYGPRSVSCYLCSIGDTRYCTLCIEEENEMKTTQYSCRLVNQWIEAVTESDHISHNHNSDLRFKEVKNSLFLSKFVLRYEDNI